MEPYLIAAGEFLKFEFFLLSIGLMFCFVDVSESRDVLASLVAPIGFIADPLLDCWDWFAIDIRLLLWSCELFVSSFTSSTGRFGFLRTVSFFANLILVN